MKRILCASTALFSLLAVDLCYADTFGSGVNSFEIEFVRIGSPGNPPDADPNPAGAVPYEYRIGKYEISEEMIDKAKAENHNVNVFHDGRGPNKPATSVTWYEAVIFVNWLNTSTGHPPAYDLNAFGFFLWTPDSPGYDASNPYRNRLARYFLPSIDEWHKAAYYDPVAEVYYDYPTGSDNVPDGIDSIGDPVFDAVFNDGASNSGPNDITDVGLLSLFGTSGQGGNVVEWQETAFDRINDDPYEQRSALGGAWVSSHTVLAAWNSGIGTGPQFQSPAIGFRVASVIPEPSTLITFGIGFVGFFGFRRLHSWHGRLHNAQYKK